MAYIKISGIANEITTLDPGSVFEGETPAGDSFKIKGRNILKIEGSENSVSSVYKEGARMRAIAALAFFQAAIAKIKSRGGVMVIPVDDEACAVGTGHGNPQYYVASDWHASIGTAAEQAPGGMTDWRARVVLQAGPCVMPAAHSWVGTGQMPSNDPAPGGSELRASGTYTGTSNRLVSMGAATYASEGLRPQSTRIEKMTINGYVQSNIVGVWSNSIQESSGLFDVCILACQHGLLIEAHANYGAANFTLERVNIADSMSGGYSANIWAGNFLIHKMTCVHTGTATTKDGGLVLRGQNIKATRVHFEGMTNHIIIGGPDTGVGNDNGYWDFNIKVDGITGYNPNTQPALKSLVWIRDDTTNVFNIGVSNLNIGSFNKGLAWSSGATYAVGNRRSISGSSVVFLECTAITTGVASVTEPTFTPGTDYIGGNAAPDGGVTWTYRWLNLLVQDDVNNIVIPSVSSTNGLHLGHYYFGGTMGVDANVPRPVFTSYYDSLKPHGAVKAAVITGTVADLSCNFVGFPYADADILQLVCRSSAVLAGLAGGRLGRVVYGHNLHAENLTLPHNSGGAAVGNRFHCAGGGPLVVSTGHFFRATYGDPRGAASWTSSTSMDCWFMEVF